jgi:glycosyltransferase involved in cell wall biosynthesis
MHILYVHQNFPAQFGHIARHLVKTKGWECSFVSETPAGTVEGIRKLQYKIAGGATKTTHFCSRTFENAVWHTDAVYQTLKAHPDLKPDLIVGHSGFGSTLFLSELYPDTPIVNFFEYYYRAHDPDSDMDFREDLNWAVPEMKYLRSRCRNAMILLDLQNCDAAYTPTEFQKSRFPDEYLPKLQTIFDGVDRGVYHGYDEELRPAPGSRGVRTIAGREVGPDTRVVTYVSRGFESMRGFDVFMKAAKKIYTQYPDVLFFIVGTDRIAYGGDESYIAPFKSFKEWTLAQDQYDLSKFVFTGRQTPEDLGKLLASGDLHMYLTVPFVLSWSMMDALSCGAVVLGSATAPVKEMIRDGENGLLADFFDTDQMAEKAVAVLRDPAAYRPLGRRAEEIVTRDYSLDAVLPRMLAMYEGAIAKRAAMPKVVRRRKVDPAAPPVVPATAGRPVPAPGNKAARSPFHG